MIWSEDRVARKDYPCDWGEGDRCPLGPIKAGTRCTYSTASPFDSLSGFTQTSACGCTSSTAARPPRTTSCTGALDD